MSQSCSQMAEAMRWQGLGSVRFCYAVSWC
jgi:hypothetical protein